MNERLERGRGVKRPRAKQEGAKRPIRPKEAKREREVVNWNDVLIPASRVGDLEGVRKALENGADVHAYDDYAFRVAVAHGHLDVVEALIAHCEDARDFDWKLRWATSRGHLDVVKVLEKHIKLKGTAMGRWV